MADLSTDIREEVSSDSHLTSLAEKTWLNRKVKSAKSEIIKTELWDHLQQQKFAPSSIRLLEQLQCVENYLWPTCNEDATHHHVLLIAFILNAKRVANLPTWTLFADRPADFSSLFRRILSLALDKTFSTTVRTEVIVCIIGAFQSLDNGLIRKECAPLVSIGIWHHLHDEAVRNSIFEDRSQFKKAWRLWMKRYEGADQAGQVRLRYERSWLYTLLLDFINRLYNVQAHEEENAIYCARFMELLTDLQSQFPTRRYVNTLLEDLNILTIIKLSPMYQTDESGPIGDFLQLLKHYTHFPLDDHTGRQLTLEEKSAIHHSNIARLQRMALRSFGEKLRLLALASYGSLSQRQELQTHFEGLSDTEISDVAKSLGYRTQYADVPTLVVDRHFVTELLLSSYEKRASFQDVIKAMPLLPTEHVLYDPAFLRNEQYNGSKGLAMPKLNLQYLTTSDFLWRSFILCRCEAFYEIRSHLGETIRRMRPKQDRNAGQSRSTGTRMGLGISKPAVVEVVPPKVGETIPAEVKAEITLDVSRLADNVRRDWEELRPDEVVFLLNAKHGRDMQKLTNGHAGNEALEEAPFTNLRAAEVINVLDENGRPLKYAAANSNGQYRRPKQRRLLVKLDAAAYAQDLKATAKGKADVYDSMNTIVRRPSRENNFKAVLESVRSLALSDVPLPLWLQDVFLGMGDPAGASYKNLLSALTKLDFRDTFVDWQHLRDALPNTRIEGMESSAESVNSLYILEASTAGDQDQAQPSAAKKRKQDDSTAPQDVEISKVKSSSKGQKQKMSQSSKKRQREDEDEGDHKTETVRVSTYKPVNMGPYPTDIAPTNKVRFTPAQVEAIKSGTQPGLTIVVGPPGTGKTDVATQIINNIYHNFPQERILLVAHSNQALNQLFQKIVALDIDQRHLLRLGQGERDLQLDSQASYGKQGRVEYFLERGSKLLSEVNRLAATMGAPGAHGNSCETAEYFNAIYVLPTWKTYTEKLADDESVDNIIQSFPFHDFFSNAPQPPFPDGLTKEDALHIVNGCYRHIEKMFVELSDIRPFEVLRRDREKANYLLVQEARIIAMTSTHAALRRHEIANLGFEYDSVIVEEAAQITEVEGFIPFAMQKTPSSSSDPHKPVESRLKRVVLCGDHLQNSPIIQNDAVRRYANLEQSLFLRLIRLGVPHVLLDAQGRARASLAELYHWRYPALHNLPHVLTFPEFVGANAGLAYDYQFIDVPDYKGKGESEPSPHFLQNLGEAEYAVALFMYMRLLGYPARQISILTTYAGQRALIRDVLGHRCVSNRHFGLPRVVSTVDKYQGEQNDYIILSLVRTAHPGYLRDLRRLTVALSRARLGLYVLGRRSVFESSPDIAYAFKLLLERPAKLRLVMGEMFPTHRPAADEVKEHAEMEGVEHLGQYVFEMTGAKVTALREGAEALPPVEEVVAEEDEDEVGGFEVVEAEDDGDVYDGGEEPFAPGEDAVDA